MHNISPIWGSLYAQMFGFAKRNNAAISCPFFGISADKLNGWVKVCESFIPSLIFPLIVSMAVDATYLDKSSTLKNDVSGKTIDILDDDSMLLKE